MLALRAHSRGGAENLVVEDVSGPLPAPDEALLAVRAVGVTFDELTWDETWADSEGNDRTPVIVGHEVSGVIEELSGSGSTDLKVGDEVYGLIDFDRDGAAAEYAAVRVANLARRPSSVDHVRTASLPLAALTAWQALTEHASIVPGMRVLVQGGGGGVGNYLVQLASAMGANVTATAAARDVNFVRDLGAAEVVAYDRDEKPDPAGYDLVVDSVGGHVLRASYSSVRPGGGLITLTAPQPPQDIERYGIQATFFIVRPDRSQLAHLAGLVDAGELKPVVAKVFPLAQGSDAYRRDLAKTAPGKIIISVP